MAFIAYLSPDDIPPEHRVADSDHILWVQGIHAKIMHLHQAFYLELMRSPGPLTRLQREERVQLLHRPPCDVAPVAAPCQRHS